MVATRARLLRVHSGWRIGVGTAVCVCVCVCVLYAAAGVRVQSFCALCGLAG